MTKILIDREVVEQAVKVLTTPIQPFMFKQFAVTALRAALEQEEQPEQEPVAVFDEQQGSPVLLASAPMLSDGQPLYTHPPREWVGLTEGDIWTLAANTMDSVLGRLHFARAIEAKLKEKNGL